jgi:SAM-dependent methyltransferase
MSPIFDTNPEVVSSLDLSKVVSHNNASVTGEGPVTVVTDFAQWSYAAAFSFRREQSPQDSPILLRIEITIEEGRIGAIAVADDLSTMIGGDVERSYIERHTTMEIRLKKGDGLGWLIVRNNAPAGLRSRCIIHSITVRRLLEKAPEAKASVTSLFMPADGQIEIDASQVMGPYGSGADALDVLRTKWSEVPVGLQGRRRTSELLELSDDQLAALWTEHRREGTTEEGFSVRGWYHELYSESLSGKRVLDVGSGFGIDGITFARRGAAVTFLDIVEHNLEILGRLCRIFGVETAAFHFLRDLDSIDRLPADFDVIWCQGSLINAPFEFTRREAQKLLQHLRVGGRWIELAYPRERWERDGCMPFSAWGAITDGEGTPWMEWYDLDRLLRRLRPVEFETVLNFNFHNDDFIWFDLIRKS